MYSFRHLVLLTAVITLMCVAVGGITLDATIVSSIAPIAMEIKFYKEMDMNAISLSKTHSRHVVGSSGGHSSKNTNKDASSNHSKWSNICKRLNEEVSSFQHLVLLTAVITLICVAVGGITLGDHIILATLRWG